MRTIKQSELLHIIKPRATELLALIYDDLKKNDLLDIMTMGVVITGGGSLLKGIDKLTQQIFSVPVRIGMPRTEGPHNKVPYTEVSEIKMRNIIHNITCSLENPIYATGYGLLLQALKKNQTSIDEPLLKRIVISMKSWVSDFF